MSWLESVLVGKCPKWVKVLVGKSLVGKCLVGKRPGTKQCSDEKIHCVALAVNSLLRLGKTVMNRQKAKFLRELMLPYHETVRKLGNHKVSTHEKRKLLQKAQVGEGVLESVTKYLEGVKSS